MPRPVLRFRDGIKPRTFLRADVKKLQRLLNQHGFRDVIDGTFGYGTEYAVKQFQRAKGLEEDGIVGPDTWSALNAAPSGPDIDRPSVPLPVPTPSPTPPSSGRANGYWFQTHYRKHHPELKRHLKAANTYRSHIDAATQRFGFQPSLIAGIGSRESKWGLDRSLRPGPGPGGTGDFTRRPPNVNPRLPRPGTLPPDGLGFGRGLMQIDYDWHAFARNQGQWADPRQNIFYACEVLKDMHRSMKQQTSLTGKHLLRAAVAAYNAGPSRVVVAIRSGEDVDFFTTGRDYSANVFARAGWFQLHGWP